jgi:tetratricopeptide (TPR) repeat protein
MEGEIYDPVSRFYKMAQSNPSYASMANEAIASVIHEKGQAVINAYLNGDLAELEKRNYYNIREGVYDRYVNMYRVALSLLQPEGRLYQRMLVASRYFEGLLVRLKMPLYPDGKSMVDSAMAILYHALSLEKNAAYIRNELANLHALKRNTDSSLFYYKKAMDLAPSWAVPPANMVGLYNQLGNQKLAKEAADKARQLQPDLVSLMMQEGVTEEQSGNWLRAEELQRRSLLSSDMHYFPYERLGYIHAATAKFAQADSFFYEAEKRRLGFYLPDPGLVATPVGFVSGPELMKSTGPCWVTPLSSPSSNPYVLILAANEYYAMKEYDSAAFYFEKALQLAPDNFIGMYHYGRLLFETNRLTEAEFYFGKANHLHTGNSIWDVLESRMLPDAPGLDSACLIRLLQGLHFPRVNCIYYLGRIYHSLGYYTRAEEAYREIFGISDMIHKTNGAHLLASLFSQLEKYLEAEKVWLQYTKDMQNLILHQEMRDNDILEDLISFAKEGVELRNFYRTMVKSDPDSYYWNSRYADHLFQLVSSNPGRYYSIEDKKEIPFEGAIDDELRDVRSWINNQNRFPFTMHPIEDSSLKFSIPLEWALGSAFSTNRNALLLADTDERMCKYHEQLAGLYIIVQKFDSAGMLYARALEFAHGNRDLRKKASESFWRGYQYSASFAQLDTLYQQKSLMVEDFIQYAQMAIQKGDQSTALMVLQSNEARLNGSPQTIQQLKGRSFFISGSDKVPGFFKDSLSGIMHDKDRFYAMAVYYAQKKHKDDAFRWLEKSVGAGFDYSSLLKYDNAWAAWRNDSKWKQITAGIKPIQYPQGSKN